LFNQVSEGVQTPSVLKLIMIIDNIKIQHVTIKYKQPSVTDAHL